MASIADLLSALNAPPALGRFSAATTLPWMNGSIGMGPGRMLVMKDPGGIEQAASAWAAERARLSDPLDGYTLADSIGAGQQTILNERARRVQEALAMRQMAAAEERANRMDRRAAAEVAARRRNDELDYMAQLAKIQDAADRAADRESADVARVAELIPLGSRLTSARDAAEARLDGLMEFLRQNGTAATSGNPAYGIRMSDAGLPAPYALRPDDADAEELRRIEAMIWGERPQGTEGPELPFNVRSEYRSLLRQLSNLDRGVKNWDMDMRSATGRRGVTIGAAASALRGGPPPAPRQWAFDPMTPGNGWRLLTDVYVPAPRQWAFDPMTRSVL